MMYVANVCSRGCHVYFGSVLLLCDQGIQASQLSLHLASPLASGGQDRWPFVPADLCVGHSQSA